MKYVAVFMLTLIVMLPVCAAQSLDITQFSGQAGVRNAALPYDTLSVKALVEVPGDAEITPNQLRLITSESITYLFDSCTASEGKFLCSLNYDLVGQGGTDIYTVALFNDDNVEVLTKVEPLINDEVDPAMKELSASQTVFGGSTTLSYRAEDYAFTTGDTEACVGLQGIKLYENGLGSPTATIPGNEDCVQDSTYEFTPQNSGEITLCAIAVDRLGRTSSPLCTDIVADSAGPDFTSGLVQTFDGYPVRAIPPDGMVGRVVVQIDEASLDPNSVRGDFGSLAANGLYDGRAPTTLVASGTTTTATWTDIPIKNVNPCQFTVRGADTFGNTNSKPFSCTILQDVSPPILLGASTGYAEENVLLLGKDGSLTARFQETSMDRNNAFLDASSLGLNANLQATCEQVNTEWHCTWQLAGSTRAQGTYALIVLPNTADDLGNQLGVTQLYEVRYDPTPPEIIKRDVKIYHVGQDYGDKVVKGDIIEFIYETEGAASIEADFTSIGGEAKTVNTCTVNDAGVQQCSITQSVELSGTYKATIPIKVLDGSGNAANDDYDVEAFGVLSEPSPNYWTSAVTCSPSVIDRSVTPILNTQVYCKVKLTSKQPQVEIVNTVLGPPEECEGDLDGSVADISVVNAGYGNREPYVRMLLTTREFPERSFSMKCPIMILSQVDDGFTENPEIETVTIKVQFGEQESIASSIDTKIETAVSEAEKHKSILDTLKKVDDIAQKVCMVRTLLWDVVAALEIALSAMAAVGLITKAVGAGEGVEQARKFTCDGKEVFQSVLGEGLTGVGAGIDTYLLKPFCDIANCQFSDTFTGGKDSSTTKYASLVNDAIDPRNSIVWAMATLCVPGIAHNVDKYRQIQCRYAVCLKQDVSEDGVPIQTCDDEKAYLTCLLIWQQAFSTIPYSKIVTQYVNAIKDIASNPFAILATLTGALCKEYCTCEDCGLLYTACSAAKVINVVGAVIGDVQAIAEPGYWKIGQGACEELEDLE